MKHSGCVLCSFLYQPLHEELGLDKDKSNSLLRNICSGESDLYKLIRDVSSEGINKLISEDKELGPVAKSSADNPMGAVWSKWDDNSSKIKADIFRPIAKEIVTILSKFELSEPANTGAASN